MSSPDRKRAQQEAYLRMLQRQQQARWNPDLPEEELNHFHGVCEKMFAALLAVCRPGANLTNPKRGEPEPRSHVGGPMLMRGAEPWPSANGEPMCGVLELFLEEVPEEALPEPLQGYALLQIFLELEWEDDDEPTYDDGEWLVRRIREVENRTPQIEGRPLDEMQVAWAFDPLMRPGYPDDLGQIDDQVREAFEALPESIPLLEDKFPSGRYTRIGGWPRWISGSDVGEFCLQLSGDDIGLDLGFDGCLYFGYDSASGEWRCAWEIG